MRRLPTSVAAASSSSCPSDSGRRGGCRADASVGTLKAEAGGGRRCCGIMAVLLCVTVSGCAADSSRDDVGPSVDGAIRVGTYLLVFDLVRAGDGRPITTTLSFEFGSGGRLRRVRAIQRLQDDGRLLQALDYRSGQGELTRDYGTCRDERPGELPTKPTVESLLEDTVGPLDLQMETSFRPDGDGRWIASDGQVKTILTQPGDLTSRRLERYAVSGGRLLEKLYVRRLQKKVFPDEPLPSCVNTGPGMRRP